jgi:hypothetical protein
MLDKSRFWQSHATTVLNERQIKVLNRLADSAGEAFEHRKPGQIYFLSRPLDTYATSFAFEHSIPSFVK